MDSIYNPCWLQVGEAQGRKDASPQKHPGTDSCRVPVLQLFQRSEQLQSCRVINLMPREHGALRYGQGSTPIQTCW